jgi:hypothetical protein
MQRRRLAYDCAVVVDALAMAWMMKAIASSGSSDTAFDRGTGNGLAC